MALLGNHRDGRAVAESRRRPKPEAIMIFSLKDACAILPRTPLVLRAMLDGLPDPWMNATQGSGTWSPYDIVGHLVHGERADWLPRVEHILQHGDAVPFPPFDREAMFEASKGKTLADLLDEFDRTRRESLRQLETLRLTEADLSRIGRHQEFGVVTLGQHLSTWVVHDFTHINQIVRTLATQYRDAVGPWRAYLSVIRDT